MQLPLFPQDKTPALPVIPDNPSAIVVSVSGGIDSSAAAIWARRRWPEQRLILWHAHLEGMDWPQTQEQISGLAALGNCRIVAVQAVYALNGLTTPGGANGTTLRRLHTVRDGDTWYGPASDNDPAAMPTLLDFAIKARNGQPPTSRIRYCTDYFKIRACDTWLRTHRAELGIQPLLISGERWAESSARAKLSAREWRFATRTWDVLWVRPVIDLAWHAAVRLSIDAEVPIHPGYFLQGETLNRMLDPERDERGRARLSCVCCIFSHQRNIATALRSDPANIEPFVERIQAYEQATGYTWQQRGSMLAS